VVDLHKHLIEAWDCAFGDSGVVYLSGPITTGRKFVERVRAGLSAKQAKDELIGSNCRALVEAASDLRRHRHLTVVEPASLNVRDWSQDDYLDLWKRFIAKHVRRIIFVVDWQFSIGCATEFEKALEHGIATESISGAIITREDGLALLSSARDELLSDTADGKLSELADEINSVIGRLTEDVGYTSVTNELRKDASLDFLAQQGFNVAQFVSFSPKDGAPTQEFSRIVGYSANERFPNVRAAIETLLRASPDGTVNIRSYEPFNPQSRDFRYGLRSADEAHAEVLRLTKAGLYTIVNETIDVNDGGVSGVLMGDVLEFAPDATPRCVETAGTASLPRGWGRELLATVYGLPLDLAVPQDSRLEFSIHPRPRGWKETNVIVWEYAPQATVDTSPQLAWPNNFSRLIGDKAFGLLVAYHIGLPVPRTSVINRRVAPFEFGLPTGWPEKWIRTAPIEQVPGKFTTKRGWIDPFKLLRGEDPNDADIASVIAQDGVRPEYSGALIVGRGGKPIIEGRRGDGEAFMLGAAEPESLPENVVEEVTGLFELASGALGPVRLEWVFDGKRAWVVQLHRGATETDETHLTKTPASKWIEFDASKGLETLRELISGLAPDTGIEILGRVGLTSHIADVIRKAKVAAKMRQI
jgi:hypothetical protein